MEDEIVISRVDPEQIGNEIHLRLKWESKSIYAKVRSKNGDIKIHKNEFWRAINITIEL